jgi:acyl-CoA thioester hydrolase
MQQLLFMLSLLTWHWLWTLTQLLTGEHSNCYDYPMQHSIQVRVPFADIDLSGRIHFSAMMRYMDVAEHELMRTLGLPRVTTFPELEFPRVHASCDYHRAISYNDDLTIISQIVRVGRSSWTVSFTSFYSHELTELGPEASKPATSGQLIIVAIDKQTGRATPLPDELRAVLVAQLESSDQDTPAK